VHRSEFVVDQTAASFPHARARFAAETKMRALARLARGEVRRTVRTYGERRERTRRKREEKKADRRTDATECDATRPTEMCRLKTPPTVDGWGAEWIRTGRVWKVVDAERICSDQRGESRNQRTNATQAGRSNEFPQTLTIGTVHDRIET